MSVTGVEIRESETPARFRGPDRLREHVEKHLLKGMRAEKWRALIDSAWLNEANEEYRHRGYGDACRELGDAYETLLGAKLVMLCREKRGHAHLLCLRESIADICAPVDGNMIRGQEIEAWDSDSNLFIAANSFVRNKGWSEYCIKTGYRALPELGKERFARKAAENLAEKKRRRLGMRLLGIHNCEESGA